MLDRHRFRTWDKKANKMFDANNQLIQGTVLHDDPDLIHMQCTGLMDKHGVLIYEGDILDYDEYKYVVEWVDFGLRFKQYRYNICKHIMPQCQAHRAEIVGNIYENYELLGLKSREEIIISGMRYDGSKLY